MEYLQNSPNHKSGVHVILATLGELNTRRGQTSNWMRTFVQTITSRLPHVRNIGEYLEAHLFVHHFPVVQTVPLHYAGCMPMRMYSRHTMQETRNGVVLLASAAML